MSAPHSPSQNPLNAGSNAGKSVLAADLRITGDLHCTGTVEIMGEVEGSISAQSILVSHEGHVKGNLKAESIDLRGRVSGEIVSQSLSLRSAAQVTADIHYDSIAIENGAQIEGRLSRK